MLHISTVEARITLPRMDLNDQVYALLRSSLASGSVRPRDQLSLQGVAASLGVSRSPVHHALTRLVSEGLVSVQPRKGYFVTPITTKVMHDAYDVRLPLELMVAERTIRRVTDEDLERLNQLMLATFPPAGTDATSMDPAIWHRANQAFHAFQIDLARNPLATDIFRRLSVNLLMERILRGSGGPWLRDVTEEHAAIVAAYERRDLAGLQSALRLHNETSRRVAAEAIEQAGGEV